jgi:LPXTG-motif cell wall-anchored protein
VSDTAAGTAAVGGGVGRSGGGGSLALPFTGAETALAALAGAGLLVVGTGATVLGRRRRQLT